MNCPFCSNKETKVLDKRVSDPKANRRRRECQKCHKRFTTYEKVDKLITKVRKRDGNEVDFEQGRITSAIWKAAQSVGGTDKEMAKALSDKVVDALEERFGGTTTPTVEQIQDIVEKVLVDNGHYKTSKAYILYRKQHEKIRETKTLMVDVNNTIGEYLNQTDWRVRENANEAFSFSGLLLHTAGKVMSNYNLNELFPTEVSNAHKKGYIHIHDLSHGVIGYCAGWSLKNLLLWGFGGVPNKVDCKPAKHLSTVVHQMVNYIGCLQMEFAGAQAFSVHPKETVIIRDSEGNISIKKIGEFCDNFIENSAEILIGPNGIELADIRSLGYETMSFDREGNAVWKPIKRVVRHPITDPLHIIKTNKGILSASKSHSLFSLNSHQYLGFKEKLLLESMENNGQKLFSYELNDRAKELGIKAPEKVVQKLVSKDLLDSQLMTYEGEVRHYSKYTTKKNKKSFILKNTEDLNRICKEVKTSDTDASNVAVLSKVKLPEDNEIDLYDIVKNNGKLRKYVMVRLDNTEKLKRDIRAKTTMRLLSLEKGKCRGYIFSALKNKKIPFEIYDRFSTERGKGIELTSNRNSNSINTIIKGKELESFVKLVAWYLSEGYSTQHFIGITQKDKNNIKEIKSILDSLEFDYNISKREIKQISVSGIAAIVIKTLCGKHARNKNIPSFIFNLNKNLKRIFLEEIIKGDGTKAPNGWIYTSTSNKLVTGLNLLSTNLGFRTSIKMRHMENFEENLPSRFTRYDLVINTRHTNRIERHGDFESAVVLDNQKADLKTAFEYDLSVEGTESFIGGTGLFALHNSSVDTLLAPFIRADNLTYKQVKQNMQQLVFSLNIPSRWGAQFPFSNVTFDWVVPDDMKDEKAIVGGKRQDYTYADCKKEMDMINKAFIEVMVEGDANGSVFSFPIPTYNLTKHFNWDSENAKLLFEMTAKYGLPYFQNYIGSNLDPKSIRAMCCRLNLNQNELMKRPGGMWGPGDSTGSIGVVTINVNRLAYEAKKESENEVEAKTLFFNKIKHYMNLAKISQEIKREVIERNLKNGLMPFTKRYLGTFNNHFSTIGLCGMNEACLNLLGKDIASPNGKQLAIDTLKFMSDVCLQYQKDSGNLYNLEATPAEGASYRLAREDKKMYPDIITAGKDEPYLTNSTQLPVDYSEDAICAIEHQNDLQHLYTGGCVDANTKILTNVGLKKIKDIVGRHAGLKVLSYNEKINSTEFKEIEDSMYVNVNKGSKMRIIMEGFTEIVTSDWHPFYIIDDRLNIVKRRADEIKTGDFVLSVTNDVNCSAMFGASEDFSWLIGLLVTDGYLGKKYIGIANQDNDILKEIKRILEEKYGRKFPQYGKAKEIRIHDKRIRCELLEILGMETGPKSFTAELPKDFRNWTQGQMFRLLCGIIDGDGNVPKSGKYIRICTASAKMSEQLSELSYLLGMRIYQKKDGKHYYLFLGREAYRNYIRLFKKHIINKNKAERLFKSGQNGRKGLKCSVKSKFLYKYDTGFYATKGRISFELAKKINKKLETVQGFFVKKVENIKKDVKFCDLTVKDNHNYLAGNNGMVFVHNTIFHTFLGEKLSSGEACKNLVRKIAENTRLPYFSITPTFSVCPEHGYVQGEHFTCPMHNNGGDGDQIETINAAAKDGNDTKNN